MSSVADAPAEEANADEDVGQGALGGFLMALRTRGVRDPALLLAIERTPRLPFVPPGCGPFVHHDIALPIACGQQATSPFAVAEALLHLAPESHHRVLEIGTGSGWQAAVLSKLAKSVVTIERFRQLQQDADPRLRRHGSGNVFCLHGDGATGHAAAAPYDRVIFNAAITAVPPELLRQLSRDAQVIAPVIAAEGQQLSSFNPADGRWRPIAPANFAEMRAGRALAL